jgi:hypothetical protein
MTPAKNVFHTSDILNLALSKRVAKIVNAQPKECWKNAFFSLMEVSELARGQYVEGWITPITIPIAIEHAWIELDGQIIDPTPKSWTVQFAYFPGLRLSKDKLMQAVGDDGRLPIVWRYGWGGMEHPGYREAYRQALDYGIPELQLQKLRKGI